MRAILPMQSRHSLELRQHQNLALTPQLQQSIRFLQLSAQDLEQEVAQALADNPLLEREGEYDADDSEARADTPSDEYVDDSPLTAGVSGAGRNDFDDDGGPDVGQAVTLRDHLLQQLHVTRAGKRDQALVEILIEELDENGLLAGSLDDVLGLLPDELAVDEDELLAALRLLQSFDPPGVGARSTAECLALQLRQRAAHDPDVMACAMALVTQHLDLLAQGNAARLVAALGCSPEVLRQAHQLILTLDPKPGRAWSQSVADYIVPELVVVRGKKGWEARLNGAAVPRLRVNPVYEQWVREDRSGADRSEIQAQLQQAHGLVKSVAQRFETVLRVGQFIVQHQQAFFDKGVQAMRPLVLRDIAEVLELHESTVSRTTRQKYMQTPWGVFELKYFLGTALGGEGLAPATSATAVRAMIRELVRAEPPAKPLSDAKIAEKLAEKGVDVARRTVAKYRELDGIDPASVRKARAGMSA
ncbi:RNA polymerase factor sigma-54 [Pusillimonas minor]|uniref:RNA polymerase sigma-54 factor n=1 Tax=Pusillimonas minor TaxID=2697024 RepID=A0A842HNQ2_9BURK|nr:RNA polymerase factor sigma-54 [Pusillimonas minor]MBC2769218.1 RNA polymerase factor sigma-54 [Pusillimonas minor]